MRDPMPAWRKPGMGIEFEEVRLQTLRLLRCLIEEALDRFRIARSSGARSATVAARG
jgi:hypothetical protein